MIDFKNYYPQKIFLVSGNEQVYEEIKKNAKAVNVLSVSRFTIDHAKEIARFAIEGDGSDRVLVVYFSIFSPDAAQVLLKSLEEPDLNTRIIFVTPYPYIVPITIRSRVMIINTDHKEVKEIKLTKERAMAFVKNELSSESEDDAASRRAKAVIFLDELEIFWKNSPSKARTIYEAKHMLFKANLPTKYVVEYAIASVF